MTQSELMWLDKDDLENIAAEYKTAECTIIDKVQYTVREGKLLGMKRNSKRSITLKHNTLTILWFQHRCYRGLTWTISRHILPPTDNLFFVLR